MILLNIIVKYNIWKNVIVDFYVYEICDSFLDKFV